MPRWIAVASLLALATPAFAGVPSPHSCPGQCPDGSQGTWCPADARACGEMLAKQGWVEECVGGDGTELWCLAETHGSHLCATLGFAPLGVGSSLLALAAIRRARRRCR